MASKLVFATIISLAAAQQGSTTIISVPWIGIGSTDAPSVFTEFHASVITANPTATTLSLACAASLDCGLFPAQTLIVGPSTYNMDMGDPSPESDFTATMDCVVAKSAVCEESASGSEANFPGSSTTTYDADMVGTFGLMITAGADKLDAQAAVTTTETSESSATTKTAQSMSGSVAESVASTGVAVGSRSVSPTGTSGSVTEATGAANANAVVGGGLLTVAAGVIGGLLF
ncbi:hypothetical protein G6011_00195 [Alternaria panax]|uniref:GPI anchored protein n=1 Tax=Alternaria panax TaxID=48097 RepID=A0AAD4II54_9PLEO|nr:hypothetical protein G6011_00195 [Alternaria panax]